MFAKTKIFNLMRTLEFGYFLVLISLILLFSIFFIQSTKALFNCALASFIVGSIGWLLVTLDPRDLKEDWEVKEIEERWAEKKRAKEQRKREKAQRRLQMQNDKAKH
jgi:hypothetical protein